MAGFLTISRSFRELGMCASTLRRNEVAPLGGDYRLAGISRVEGCAASHPSDLILRNGLEGF